MTLVAWAGFLAFMVYVLGMAFLHVLPTGRRPLYNTVSDYSVGRCGPLARTLTALNAAASLCLLASLWSRIGSPPLARGGLLELGVVALARVGLVTFVTDESGTKATPRGLMHAVLAVISFAAAVSAMTTLTRGLDALSALRGILPLLRVLATLALPLVLLLAVSLTPRLRAVFGLMERLFLADVNLWLLALAGALALHG